MKSTWSNGDEATDSSSTTILNYGPDEFVKSISFAENIVTFVDQSDNVESVVFRQGTTTDLS